MTRWNEIEGLDARLRYWVGTKLSSRNVAARLNEEFGLTLTDNAVIGRTHRLRMPSRAPKPDRYAQKAKQPPRPAPEPEPEPAPAHKPPPPPSPRTAPVQTCQYPIGAPRQPGFRFCGAPLASRGTYCPAHQAVCYVRRAFAEVAEL